MRAITIVGVLLVVIGLGSFLLEDLPYATQQEAASVGPLEATIETEKSISLPPVIGGITLVGGILLLALTARRKSS